MDNSQQHPIYTEKNECQDCCRCVRMCPVKAIKIENGSANIIPQLCIACGRCTKVCPFNAKRVRSDIGRTKQLLKDSEPVYVSIAPSFRTEFVDIPENKLIAALRRLGFAGVSETALGAQEVSASVAALLKRDPTPRLYISSACPVVVDLIGKYIPAMAPFVTDLCSPAQAHARLLKKHFGDDIRVVFIGPCIGKKVEADEHPELMSLALSYNNLREWFQSEGIDPLEMQPTTADVFTPDLAAEGALYPVDGGMIAGIKANCAIHDADFMAFSGVNNVISALHDLDKSHLKRPLFLELLACEGGCVNGPLGHDSEATVIKRQQIVSAVAYDPAAVPRPPHVDAAQ